MTAPETATAARWTPPPIPRRTWLAFAVLVADGAKTEQDLRVSR